MAWDCVKAIKIYSLLKWTYDFKNEEPPKTWLAYGTSFDITLIQIPNFCTHRSGGTRRRWTWTAESGRRRRTEPRASGRLCPVCPRWARTHCGSLERCRQWIGNAREESSPTCQRRSETVRRSSRTSTKHRARTHVLRQRCTHAQTFGPFGVLAADALPTSSPPSSSGIFSVSSFSGNDGSLMAKGDVASCN